MWPTLVIAFMLLGGWLAWRSCLPPLGAKSLLKIRNGAVFLSGEPLTRQTLLAVTELLHEAGVRSGFIAIMPERRIKYSREIPARLHQQLRNVLLNY